MSIEHHDPEGDRLGMWIFLYSEILLFGGLFFLYAAYLNKFTTDFITAGEHLSTFYGTLNTVILLLSSWAVAAAITAIKRKNKNFAMGLLGFALFCAIIFLRNKYVEWGHEIHLGLYPDSQALADLGNGQTIFFGLYYTVTGLHGLHIIIGAVLLSVALWFIKTDKVNENNLVFLENAGLYWHLVDLIWIFVFPLFYLIV